MRTRAAPQQVGAMLRAVQLRHHVNEIQLGEARQVEAARAQDAAQSRERLVTAEQHWLAQLSGSRLDLEMQAICVRSMLQAAGQRDAAEAALDVAVTATAANTEKLRGADAEVRSTQKHLKQAQRSADRRLEERRTTILSERAAYRWWQQ